MGLLIAQEQQFIKLYLHHYLRKEIVLAKTVAAISGILKEPKSCSNNLKTLEVNKDIPVNQLVNEAGTIVLYSSGDAVLSGAYKITSMNIGNYDATTGRAEFKILFDLVKRAYLICEKNNLISTQYPNMYCIAEDLLVSN